MMSTTTAMSSPFGRRLRYWRGLRGLSQLDLAAAAGTTSRHVSFIETGRSRPGADLVTRLADVLAVPVRERNDLLAAAGLTPTGPVHPLDSPALQPVRDVLERVLRQHEPFPAWVIGRGLRFLAANRGAEILFPGVTAMSPEQVVDLWFGAGPYREQVVNWADVVRSTLITLRRELLVTGDGEVAALLHRAEELTRDLPLQELKSGDDGVDSAAMPVACPILRVNGQLVRTISTVMRFDHATEVTTSELRVELMFPPTKRPRPPSADWSAATHQKPEPGTGAHRSASPERAFPATGAQGAPKGGVLLVCRAIGLAVARRIRLWRVVLVRGSAQ